MQAIGRAGAWLALFVGLGFGTAQGAITPEQREQALAVQEQLREANRLLRSRKVEESVAQFQQARQTLAQLAASGDPLELRSLVVPAERRLNAFEKLLQRAGADLSAGSPGDVLFTRDVAPVLVSKCGSCHVNRSRGNFSMASFAALRQGADGLPVISPGNSANSRMIEVIRSGDMPRGGGRVSDEELALLARWIDAGAAFDGDDPSASLTDLAPSTPMASRPDRLMVEPASGDETVRFSRDLAPVLLANCTDCHGGNQTSGNLGLDRFTRLLRGGNSGPILVPGQPDESLLIQKLRGMAGARMPLRRAPLPEETIGQFATWIAEGAKFDGPDANQSTEQVAQIYQASTMSHDELAALRTDLADQNWRLGNPVDQPERYETEHFLLLGNIPSAELAQVGAAWEETQSQLVRLLGTAGGEPWIKGRLSIYIFPRRYDYSEFVRMVEDRDAPSGSVGHWRYNIIDAYVCFSPGGLDDDQREAQRSELLAGAYISSLGGVPQWFAQGSARYAATKLAPRAARAKDLDEAVRSSRARIQQVERFLTGALPPEDNELLSYGFVRFLLSAPERYAALLDALRAGDKFDEALARAYGRPADELVALWEKSPR